MCRSSTSQESTGLGCRDGWSRYVPEYIMTQAIGSSRETRLRRATRSYGSPCSSRWMLVRRRSRRFVAQRYGARLASASFRLTGKKVLASNDSVGCNKEALRDRRCYACRRDRCLQGLGWNTSRRGSMPMRMSTTSLSLPTGYRRGDGGSGALPRARVGSEGHKPQPGQVGCLSPEGPRAHQHRLTTSLVVDSSQ